VVKAVKVAPAPKPQPEQHVHRRLRRLNGQQLRTLIEASQQIQQARRQAFLTRVAIELGDNIDVGDGTLPKAICIAMAALHLHRVTTL
jgi:hypothetical protein